MRPIYRRVWGLAVAGILSLPAVAQDYSDYHTYEETTRALRGMSSSANVTLESAGKSSGGRDIWIARIGTGSDQDTKPALFVGANIAGWHNAGTEAALDLIETLSGGEHGALLSDRTFYVAPILNPDAHDAMFSRVRVRRDGNDQRIDYDVDGFVGEDGYDDLDGDGRITRMRVPDPTGTWLPHPDDPRVLIRADSEKGRVGIYKLETEGNDDDRDGSYNEDPREGVAVDMNFAHRFPWPKAEAGPWASYAPESKAIMDYLLAHRNVALAVVYGPANNLLEMPQSLGGGGDLGTQRFTVPQSAAEFMGLDPDQEYTLDEVWEVAKDLPFVQQNNITKEQIAQFLGAGPATKVADEDMKILGEWADDYKEILEEAELDVKRPAEQYQRGGFTPWLYYQYSVPAIELDVWGIPKAEEEKKEGEEEEAPKLTKETLGDLSPEEFLAFGEEAIAEFLEEVGAPAHFTAEMVMQRVESGQITPEQMARMMEQMPGGGSGDTGNDEDGDDPDTKRAREVLAWVDEHAPDAFAPWKTATLSDGTEVMVGGLDPFIQWAPPMEFLEPAIDAHTRFVLELAAKPAQFEIRSVDVEPLGGGVYRVEAVARNVGELPSHTAMAKRSRAIRPVRLEIETGDGVELITGRPGVTEEQIAARTGSIRGVWLVRADRRSDITINLLSENAGRVTKIVKVEGR